MTSIKKNVYISYSWGAEERHKIVDELLAALKAKGVEVKRDINETNYGESFRAYMDKLAAGGAIILVLSEEYFKSPNCMYELREIYLNNQKEFRQRIFPVVLKGTKFHRATDRVQYIRHWEEETVKLNAALDTVARENIGTVSHNELRDYADFRRMIDDLLALIGDMNHLTEEEHLKTGFTALIERIFSRNPPSGGGGTDKTGLVKTAGDQFSSEGGNQQIAKDHGTINNNYFFAPKESVPPSGHQKIFFGVPNLPPNHLPRQEYIDEFRTALQKESNLGMEGMGGIGKSVLAAALAHDKAVQSAFPDGIFWLTFGQKVENDVLLVQQNNILKLLGHQEQENSLDLSKHKLKSVLHGKRCLFIIDDIWDSRHLKCFDLSGTACRFLLTSRKADVLDRLDMERKRIDLLSEEQALTMLAQYARCALADLPKEAAEIAKECGYLPLAVAAIGSMVRGKPADRWQLALCKLQEAKLDKIACKFDYQYENLFRALQVSVEALPEAQQQYYKTLAVFPEDANIPESVVVLYWEHCAVSDDAPQDVIDAIVDASLLTRVDNDSLRLHDLLRDYLISQTEDVAALHKQLLEAYKAEYPGGWHTIPYEEYPYLDAAAKYFHDNWIIHARKSDAADLSEVIGDAIIRYNYTIDLNYFQESFKFIKCCISDIAPDLLATHQNIFVIAELFKSLEDSAKEPALCFLKAKHGVNILFNLEMFLGNNPDKYAREWLHKSKDSDIIAACLSLLHIKAKEEAEFFIKITDNPSVIKSCFNILKEHAEKDAKRLINESDNPRTLVYCLDMLGCKANNEAVEVLRKSNDPSVIISCLNILKEDAVEDAKRLFVEISNQNVINLCVQIIGKEFKQYARKLLRESNDNGVILRCLSILLGEAKEEAWCFLKKSHDPDIIIICLHILWGEATEEARRLLQDNKHPRVIANCLALLGEEALEDARLLLRKSEQADIIFVCFQMLGSEAKTAAKRLLRESKDDIILDLCLKLLGDEAKEEARHIVKFDHSEWLLMTCIRILGKEARPVIIRLAKTGGNSLIRDKYKNILRKLDNSENKNIT